MKIKIVLEEVINQEFEVEVSNLENAYDEVRDMYKTGRIVVENPNLTSVSLSIEEDGEYGEFMDLHII